MPDVREGGRWTTAQRIKNGVLYVVVMVSVRVASLLPAAVARTFGRALGHAAWALVPSLRRRVAENLSRAAIDLAPRTAFVSMGDLLGATIAGLERPLDPLPLLPGARACLDEAIAEGRGVVFASAHLGPWERVAASLVAAGIPLTVVAREPYDPRFRTLYDRLRARRGVPAIYRGAPGAAVALARTLRKGGVLGIPMDFASRVPSIDVPFLGVPAPTPSGPAALALRFGAAVVVGTVAIDEGVMGISFERITTDGGVHTLTTRINQALSARIRAMPAAWPWMHERWPKRAPERYARGDGREGAPALAWRRHP
jgi:Kdo2-lipid IVA lauroyltransferase/acyltransferase